MKKIQRDKQRSTVVRKKDIELKQKKKKEKDDEEERK